MKNKSDIVIDAPASARVQSIRNRVAHDQPVSDVDTKWFKEQMANQMVSLRQLAPRMGLYAPALSLMINGKRKMQASEAVDLAKHLMVPVNEVLRRAGLRAKETGSGSVPVVAWLDAQGRTRKDGLGPKTVAGPADASEGLEAIRAQTGGHLDGWVFFYRPVADIPLEAVGRLCIVQVAGEDGMRLRFVGRGYELGLWHLTPMDGGPVEAARLTSAAPIVWVRQ